MKKRIFSMILVCFLIVQIVKTDVLADDVTSGWAVSELIRVGTNGEHGFAYLELTSAGPHAGVFQNVIFQVDESIRKEALAVGLTALALDVKVRVKITSLKNAFGYQIVKAVYTYVPVP